MLNSKKYIAQTFFSLLIIFEFSTPFFAFAKADTFILRKSTTIKWNPCDLIKISDSSSITILSFVGSTTREGFGMLPVSLQSIRLKTSADSILSVVMENPVFEPVQDYDQSNVRDLDKIPSEISIFHEQYTQRKIPNLQISVLPLRRNLGTGMIERLISFDLIITIKESDDLLKTESPNLYAANSILAQGVWYKFATNVSGIYKLTFEDLQKAVINAGAIDPRNIRIYGNGGGMLPEANSAQRIDDLIENSIFVYTAIEGKFGAGDYFLFYGSSPDQWIYNKTDQIFHHKKNIYSDRAYYFLNFDTGPGKRITTESATTQTANNFISKFDDYIFYEKDEISLLKSGRVWYDHELFDLTTTRNYSFNFPNLDPATPLVLTSVVAARSTTGSTSFAVFAQNQRVMTITIPPTGSDYLDSYAIAENKSTGFSTTNPVIDIRMVYNRNSINSSGYLNYLELNAKRLLKMDGNQMLFRSVLGSGKNLVSEFSLAGNSQNIQIWDVTKGSDIKKIQTNFTGTNYVFRLPTDTLREFIAFDGNSFFSPEFVGRVDNQNLHGAETADYIIVSYPAFNSEAERLANFHRQYDHLSVLVTTPDQIYNEFSSGAQDITAIRDFVRMIYKKAEPGKEPKYLLLFGDGSFDFKNRVQNNTNFVPSFQSAESLDPVGTYVTDDYFALMDENEGQGAFGELDLGVGRFPVVSIEQAKDAVDKVLHYVFKSDSVKRDWRNVVTFVADDQNIGGNLFINDSENLAKIIETSYKDNNVDKIYSDSYTMVSTPGGPRYPDVNAAINRRIEKGTLMINYVGHGGEVGWAHERILEVPDIKNWKNYDNLTVFVTATCEFARFDNPELVSAGEWAFLNPKGGGIALFTTTRPTFAGGNYVLANNLFQNAFKKVNGKHLNLGDLIMLSKVSAGSDANARKFVLLGDPAIHMAYPEQSIVTTSINNQSQTNIPDTLSALEEITITGEIRDASGNKMNEFSGVVFPTVFDKATEIWTNANYGEDVRVPFFLRKNSLYKGKVAVTNGSFTFSFIIPKDISYQFGIGKISYYARSKETDASGYDENIIVGGYNNRAFADNEGPLIRLYINDQNFVSGGITNQDPNLLAYVSDESGINTVGNGIGHDILGVLDGNTKDVLVLNDYYVSDDNTYKSGVINYRMPYLSNGEHSVTLKVWDVYNNSSVARVDFLVVSTASFAFKKLMNFPNPFSDKTTFSFEYNFPYTILELDLRIYSLFGKLVKTFHKTVMTEGFKAEAITWDGRGDDGELVGSGTYVYRLQVSLPDGTSEARSSRLVFIR